MYALHEHIGGDQHFRVRIVKHGAIVAYTFYGRLVLYLDVIGESVYEAELTEL